MNNIEKYLLIYLLGVSLLTVVFTVYDKLASKSKKGRKHRVPEKTLLLLSALGGSAAQYITMLLIRHKTAHKKFMIGLPLMIIGQAVVLAILITTVFA